LAVSATCVYQLIGTGKIACHRIGVGRGAIRIDESDLAVFLDSSRVSDRSVPAVARRKQTKSGNFRHLRLDRP
jgi:hypothetical protein